jgi:hypothetical protein
VKKNRTPAPAARIYQGVRIDGTAHVTVNEPNGNCRRLSPRFDLQRHSPTGFEWGYGGSGPAQLALALCCDATGDDTLACRTYQDFKFAVVAGLPESWQLTAAEVAAKVAELHKPEKVGGWNG